MAGPAINLENVSKSFADNKVLRGIDLGVPAGGSLVVIGPSGTGKTVLLKTLIGVHAPDGGRITVDGTDVSTLAGADKRALYGRFGMLFQKSGLFDSLPVSAKVFACTAMSASLIYIIFFRDLPVYLVALTAAVMAYGAWFILTKPSHVPTDGESA